MDFWIQNGQIYPLNINLFEFSSLLYLTRRLSLSLNKKNSLWFNTTLYESVRFNTTLYDVVQSGTMAYDGQGSNSGGDGGQKFRALKTTKKVIFPSNFLLNFIENS